MHMRPVPRNIDRPNRLTEYVISFMISYYSIMFTVQHVLMAWGAGIATVYVVFRLTQNKPEGSAFRVFYRLVCIGKFFPNPKTAKKFEI